MFYSSDVNSVMRRRAHTDYQSNFAAHNQFTHLKRYSLNNQFSLRYMDFINKLPSIIGQMVVHLLLMLSHFVYSHISPHHLHSNNVKLYCKSQNIVNVTRLQCAGFVLKTY